VLFLSFSFFLKPLYPPWYPASTESGDRGSFVLFDRPLSFIELRSFFQSGGLPDLFKQLTPIGDGFSPSFFPSLTFPSRDDSSNQAPAFNAVRMFFPSILFFFLSESPLSAPSFCGNLLRRLPSCHTVKFFEKGHDQLTSRLTISHPLGRSSRLVPPSE